MGGRTWKKILEFVIEEREGTLHDLQISHTHHQRTATKETPVLVEILTYQHCVVHCVTLVCEERPLLWVCQRDTVPHRSCCAVISQLCMLWNSSASLWWSPVMSGEGNGVT